MIQSARPPTISRTSFARRGRSGPEPRRYGSGKRKKNILEAPVGMASTGAKITQRPDAADTPIGEQDKTVTDPLGIDQLMDCEQETATLGCLGADHADDLTGLPEIEAVERFVHQKHVMGCEQTQSQQEPPAKPLR